MGTENSEGKWIKECEAAKKELGRLDYTCNKCGKSSSEMKPECPECKTKMSSEPIF